MTEELKFTPAFKPTARLEAISIRNFKNVVKGDLCFTNKKKNYRASIVGLYGQNGSGKTALIESLSILKHILCGIPVPVRFADCINVDADCAGIVYDIVISDDETKDEFCRISYEVEIRRREPAGTEISKEVIKYSLTDPETGRRSPRQVLADTGAGDVFGPKSRYDDLTGKNRKIKTDLIVAKKLASATDRSFLFSRELRRIMDDNCREKDLQMIFYALSVYGRRQLFIIDSATSGRISLNALPLIIGDGEHGSVSVSLNDGGIVPDNLMPTIRKVVSNMNIVLPQVVPGLEIGIVELGSELLRDGRPGTTIQLVSKKAGKEISLKYESEGIKKIIAIMQLLIAVYNDDSITVCIDELDAGVYEYLLGEILKIISEKGRGQLIFTSHNLRPLETIDTGFVAFTTADPEHRYTRITGKGSANLRDSYYRDIVLGCSGYPMYEPTHNAEISLAFREAGELYDFR